VSGVFTGLSGLPANITNGRSSYPNSRPDYIGGIDPVYSNFQSTLQYLNPAAFVGVPLSSASGASVLPGNLGRNAIRLPGTENVDLSVAKNIAIREHVRFQLRGDAFNAFNHTNLTGLVTDISKSNFGRLTSATPRNIQIGARVSF